MDKNELTVKLKPTVGCYQPVLSAKLVGEGKTFWRVRPDGIHYDWKFSKNDKLRVGPYKHDFPRYRIEFTDESMV